MYAPVVDEWNRAAIDRHPIEFGRRNTSTPPLRIRHRDLVARTLEPPHDLIIGPGRRNARVDAERVAASLQAEHAFEARTIHPRGRSGIPAPAAAAGVRGSRVEIAGDDIRFRFITLDVSGSPRMVD